MRLCTVVLCNEWQAVSLLVPPDFDGLTLMPIMSCSLVRLIHAPGRNRKP